MGRDRRGRQLHPPRPRPGHRTPPDRPARRRLRPPAPLRGRPPLGAAERRRHGQGPVERLPERGPAPPLRPGPRPRVPDRRHLRPPRRAVRHLHPGPQHRALRRRHPAVRLPCRPGAVQARRRQERPGTTGLAALALLLPGRRDPRRRLPRLHRLDRPRRQRDPARRTGRDGAARERPAPCRPARRLRQLPAGGAGLARRGHQAGRPAVGGHPEGRRAFLNTAEFLAARGLI